MELKDLLGIPVSDLTTTQLEEKVYLLGKLKLTAIKTTKSKSNKPKAIKSNKTKQMENLLEGVDLSKLAALLKDV